MRNLIFLLLTTVLLVGRAPAQSTRPFMTGVDANYSLDLEKAGKTWSAGEKPGDLFAILHDAGVDTFRVRLWTGDDGVNGLNYATTVAKRAHAAGMKPYLVIFLSENWSDLVKQPLPAVWKNLDEPAKLAAIEAYAERVTKHFIDAGINVELFEIGNEIDFGICGVFEEAWPNRMSVDYMRARVWPRMIPIIQAAERGVKKAQPNAKFILHLAQWAKADWCTAFWQAMLAGGVQVDYPSLSYFPTSAGNADERPLAFLHKQVDAIYAALNRPVVICESGYPSAATFPGQFADWNKPVAGYTLDPAGQQKWVADYFAAARADEHFAGVFYWSPEWYASDLWSEFALFDGAGKAKPALTSLAPVLAASATQPSGAINVYFGNLHSHTSYSDGSGTPEQAYTMARDEAKLDFLAITEHNHILGGEKAPPEKRTAFYAGSVTSSDLPPDVALIPVANRLNADGKFVSLYGQEFSSMSKGNHVNVFDVPAVIDVPNGKFDTLLKWMDALRDSTGGVAVMQFNHPGLDQRINPKIQYGRDDFENDAGWLEHMGGATSLIELLNGEPEANAPRKRAPQIMEEDYRKYLNLGFHLAPTGDQDNHKLTWGTVNDVRTGILAPALTRPALLAAMRARHVYATEDKNLKVIVRVNGHLCGDVVQNADATGDLKIDYDITDADEPTATYVIDVFQGTVGKGLARTTKTSEAIPAGTGSIDGVRLDADRRYVFFRITQTGTDGPDRAWTAPVWFETK